MRLTIAFFALHFLSGHVVAESTITIDGKTIKSNSGQITIQNGKVITGGEGIDDGFIRGSGNLISEERDLKDFDELSLNISAKLLVRSGPETKFSITADNNILPVISTESRGGLLRIDAEESFSTDSEIRIEIEVPRLAKAELNGSGIIDIRDVTQDDVDLSISGSGDIQASGQAKALSVAINGSGNLLAADLKAEQATVTLNGSGNADIHASKVVRARVMGAGTVSYYGQPEEVHPSVLGSGSIDKK